MPATKIPCCIIRGGTSKGIFVDERVLPPAGKARDEFLLSLFGSPDIRQIDGLGGADPLTSKLAIVSKSDIPGIDVEFLAAEVRIDRPEVHYGIMCGNTASGVGHFAMDQNLIQAGSPVTRVRIYCRNNGKTILADIPTHDGQPDVDGACVISGVPGSAAPVTMTFQDPAGAVTGQLLPTGNALDVVNVDGADYEFSLVDSGTLYAFLKASSLSLTGVERPNDLDNDERFNASIRKIRVAIAEYLDRVRNNPEAPPFDFNKVKIALVASPTDYESLNGQKIAKTDIDLLARIANPLKLHKAYAVSGAICLGSASTIEGTLVNQIVSSSESPQRIRIGHPSGTLAVQMEFAKSESGLPEIKSATLERTARILISGTAHVNIPHAA